MGVFNRKTGNSRMFMICGLSVLNCECNLVKHDVLMLYNKLSLQISVVYTVLQQNLHTKCIHLPTACPYAIHVA